jgi:hypothetical protein
MILALVQIVYYLRLKKRKTPGAEEEGAEKLALQIEAYPSG